MVCSFVFTPSRSKFQCENNFPSEIIAFCFHLRSLWVYLYTSGGTYYVSSFASFKRVHFDISSLFMPYKNRFYRALRNSFPGFSFFSSQDILRHFPDFSSTSDNFPQVPKYKLMFLSLQVKLSNQDKNLIFFLFSDIFFPDFSMTHTKLSDFLTNFEISRLFPHWKNFSHFNLFSSFSSASSVLHAATHLFWQYGTHYREYM